MRHLINQIANVIKRAIVNRLDPDGAFAQVESLGGHVTPEVEVLQPQGVHFALPSGAEGVLAAVTGDAGNAVLISGSERTELPADVLLPGEGGLHFRGDWKVFLGADGTLRLTAKEPTDFVALSSKVDAALDAIVSAVSAGLNAGGSGPAYAGGAAQASAFTSALGANPLPTGSLMARCD